jgi:hypothetical protein
VSKRHEEIRRIVAELDAHVAQVEASLAVLKALLAEEADEARREDLSDPATG